MWLEFREGGGSTHNKRERDSGQSWRREAFIKIRRGGRRRRRGTQHFQTPNQKERKNGENKRWTLPVGNAAAKQLVCVGWKVVRLIRLSDVKKKELFARFSLSLWLTVKHWLKICERPKLT